MPVTIRTGDGKPVPASSMLAVLSLGAKKGTEVTLEADGDGRREAPSTPWPTCSPATWTPEDRRCADDCSRGIGRQPRAAAGRAGSTGVAAPPPAARRRAAGHRIADAEQCGRRGAARRCGRRRRPDRAARGRRRRTRPRGRDPGRAVA